MTATINLNPAARAKLPIAAGQYVDFTINVTNADITPFNFTGYTAKCQIRNQQKGKDYLLLAFTVVLTTGLIRIYGDVPTTIELGTFSWALELTNASSKPLPWIVGPCVISVDGAK